MTASTNHRPDGREFRVRPFADADRPAMLSLAPRLTEGIAPWRDAGAFLDAAIGWIEASIDGIGPQRAVYVAEDRQGQCIGFISVAYERHFTGDEQAYIGELAVAATAQGQGAGRALVEAAEDWARRRGYGFLALDTGAANERARRFYRGLGFGEESVKLVKQLPSGSKSSPHQKNDPRMDANGRE